MKKTVLHFLKSNSFSGAENVAITLIRSMRERFPEQYEMVYVSPNGPIRDVLKRENILFEPLEDLNIKEIKRVCSKYNPDIVHAHDFTASILCAAAKKKYKLISHLHQNPPWSSSICPRTVGYCLSLARYDKIVCVSRSIPDGFAFHALSGAVVLDNPVDLGRIKALAEASAGTSEYDVVFLGRLSEPKNPLRFISIIGTLSANLPGLKAAMVGDGELRQECEAAVKNAGLENNIDLLGFKDNPYPILANSNVLCVPSLWEGFGLVAVEALALGVPVVASPVGGLPGIVDEACGALCDSDEDFAAAISDLLNLPELWRQKSISAAKRASDMDNLEAYNNSIDKFYREV